MTEEKDNKDNLIQVAGLWKRTSRSGEIYSAGRWGDVYVSLFKNKFKTTEEHPDYVLCLSPVRSKRKPDEKGTSYQTMTKEGEENFNG